MSKPYNGGLVWDTLCVVVLGFGLAVFGLGEQLCRLAVRMAEIVRKMEGK